MRDISHLDAMKETIDHMSNGGVFLSVGGEAPNTLTIGWGSIGYYWRMPVFTAVVRPQRHTYPILKSLGQFTVSVPTTNPLKAELAFCGTKSGSEFNKFEGHGITAIPGKLVDAPIVAECGLHFECVVKLMQDMTPDQMDKAVLEFGYPQRDMHTMFFAEIVACYRTDEN